MKNPANQAHRKTLIGPILTDVQFWIPAVVLLGGLWVLHWIR